MNFPICLLLSLLLSCAICGKNDKKKATTVENDNKNSIPTMTKALRMLTKILAVQSVIGLANGYAPPGQTATNVADQKSYSNVVDQIMSQPKTKMEMPPQFFDEIAAAEEYNEMPTSSHSQMNLGNVFNADYPPIRQPPPIHNNKNN
ncbi:hypothetical protein niasHT_012736 [Heterodera trifolii]|uniref:Effector protein n=1 Tax=Heterodera trifolii TaxID=157864 RepID=A0ABD2L8K2_9BILA